MNFKVIEERRNKREMFELQFENSSEIKNTRKCYTNIKISMQQNPLEFNRVPTMSYQTKTGAEMKVATGSPSVIITHT